ncbi:MAG: polysaccharide export protein [Methylacidiphilaceae bacterium]|nr:polysaccharide export protein [Candidatus Methylacidiphilaceae bacterium]
MHALIERSTSIAGNGPAGDRLLRQSDLRTQDDKSEGAIIRAARLVRYDRMETGQQTEAQKPQRKCVMKSMKPRSLDATGSVRFAILTLLCSASLSGCAIKSAAGPSTGAIRNASAMSVSDAGIQIINVTDDVARRIIAHDRPVLFSDNPGDGAPIGSIIGKGDVLDIGLWEAPPAALFGSAGGDPRLTSSGSTARGTSLPEQMVDTDGCVTIPFVGRLRVAGKTPQQVSHEIVARLAGKAHQPQAIIRIIRNSSMNVTVVGDVTRSDRFPLTPKGERLLDVLAGVGGVKSPISKTVIQITRGNDVTSLPLETIIRDPRQNIRLEADDVITALYQPYTFTVLGATGQNAEIPFEATGLSLSQALGRAGGLQDQRANARGAFLFRLEDPSALDPSIAENARKTPDGKIPVIYQIDMKNPSIFFSSQNFPIRNKDVIYVSNSSMADMQKFTNIISSLVFPMVSVANTNIVK